MSKVAAREPRSAALELLGLVLGVEALLWAPLLPGFPTLRLPVVALLGVLCWRSRQRRMRGGSRAAVPERWLPSWLQTLVATALVGALVLLSTRVLGWWVGDAPRFDAAALATWGDLGWWLDKGSEVLLQQLLLQFFVLPLALEISGRPGPALLLSGAVFGGVHLPNPALSALTALAAPLWCWLYLRTGRWLPLVASHMLLAILVRGACGDAIYSMRVGASVLSLLPRTIAAADGSQLRVLPRSLEGFVDECELEGAHVACKGWSADADRRRASDAVVVLGGGSLRRFGLSASARPDVAAAFGMPELHAVGFELELPLEWFEEPEPPRFFAVSGSQIAELEYLTDRRPTR